MGFKDYFIDKFIRLHTVNVKSSALSFKNFEDIPFKPEAFDGSRQAKIFLIVSNVAVYSSKL